MGVLILYVINDRLQKSIGAASPPSLPNKMLIAYYYKIAFSEWLTEVKLLETVPLI